MSDARERQRRAAMLRSDGLSYDQIAEAMQVSRAAVCRYLQDADRVKGQAFAGDSGDQWAYRLHFAREEDWREAMALAKRHDARRWTRRAFRVRLNLDEQWPRPTR